MKVEFVSYDGGYPNLCSGDLVLRCGDTEYKFPPFCLRSGGGVWFDEDWKEHVDSGEWSIEKWPEGFPEEARASAEKVVNDNIEQGCCGGCI